MKLLDTSSLDWIHFTGNDSFDYPIDYWASVLSTRADGHIDMLFRWEPNAYCHFHRHLVDTTTTVLQGEHHVIEIAQGKEAEHKVRLAGDYAHKPAGDLTYGIRCSNGLAPPLQHVRPRWPALRDPR